jgi:V8-like Glu-specific endopeptidase
VPVTTFAGAYERATGKDPFALPASWIQKKSKIDLSTPLDFCSTNDIIGGNSGSPVFDKDARIVGLVFDGNIHSLGGDYYYDPKDNRTVAVHSAGLLEALDKIYGATRITSEIKR